MYPLSLAWHSVCFREQLTSSPLRGGKSVQAVDGDSCLPGPDTDPDPVCTLVHDSLLAEVDGQMIGSTWLTW